MGTGDGQFDLPEGVAVDTSGNLYVVDFTNDRVQKFGPPALSAVGLLGLCLLVGSLVIGGLLYLRRLV